jgi:hypothetical protein
MLPDAPKVFAASLTGSLLDQDRAAVEAALPRRRITRAPHSHCVVVEGL